MSAYIGNNKIINDIKEEKNIYMCAYIPFSPVFA